MLPRNKAELHIATKVVRPARFIWNLWLKTRWQIISRGLTKTWSSTARITMSQFTLLKHCTACIQYTARRLRQATRRMQPHARTDGRTARKHNASGGDITTTPAIGYRLSLRYYDDRHGQLNRITIYSATELYVSTAPWYGALVSLSLFTRRDAVVKATGYCCRSEWRHHYIHHHLCITRIGTNISQNEALD